MASWSRVRVDSVAQNNDRCFFRLDFWRAFHETVGGSIYCGSKHFIDACKSSIHSQSHQSEILHLWHEWHYIYDDGFSTFSWCWLGWPQWFTCTALAVTNAARSAAARTSCLLIPRPWIHFSLTTIIQSCILVKGWMLGRKQLVTSRPV